MIAVIHFRLRVLLRISRTLTPNRRSVPNLWGDPFRVSAPAQYGLLRPITAKKMRNRAFRPWAQSDLLGPIGSYWDQKNAKTPFHSF